MCYNACGEKMFEIKDAEKLFVKFKHNENLLTLPEITSDTKLTVKLTKENAKLKSIATHFEKYKTLESEIQSLQNEVNQNRECQNIFQDEINSLQLQKQELFSCIQTEYYKLNCTFDEVVLEMQNKNSLELQQMLCTIYQNFCKAQNLDFVVQKNDETVKLEISGENCFALLSQESGFHRIAGKKNSFVVVYVYRAQNAKKHEITADNVKVDIFRSSGAGGQNVNKVSTAIRVTHLPTGIVATCQDERSQFENRAKAFEYLSQKLDAEFQKEQLELNKCLQKSKNHIDALQQDIKVYDFASRTIMNEASKNVLSFDFALKGNL